MAWEVKAAAPVTPIAPTAVLALNAVISQVLFTIIMSVVCSPVNDTVAPVFVKAFVAVVTEAEAEEDPALTKRYPVLAEDVPTL